MKKATRWRVRRAALVVQHSLERDVDDGEVAVVLDVTDGAEAQHAAKALGGDGEGVVLAGDVEALAGPGAAHDLVDGVELRRLGEVGEVAGVDEQVRRRGQSVDAVDGKLEGGGDVLVGVLGEANVAVADLDE